jgi:hypothetical protein
LFRDFFDRLHWLALGGVVVAVAYLLVFAPVDGTTVRKQDKRLELALQEKAKAAFLLETYGPVEALAAAGNRTAALLKLEELERDFPGEAHASILRGALLLEQGAITEGIRAYVLGVRQNGDYIDERSVLGRHDEIEALVTTQLPFIKLRVERTPDNRTWNRALKNIYYLQSRLAGGCE